MILGSLAGIRLRLNWMFGLLMAAAIPLDLWRQALVLFTLVLIHELVHSLVAHMKGIPVSEIELYPFGGVARIDAGLLEQDPGEEILVAVAGPLANFALVFLALKAVPPGDLVNHHHWWYFFRANLTMGVINLLPVWPLDGGRVARALIARRLGLGQATKKVLDQGRWLAVLLGLLGLGVMSFTNYPVGANLIALGIFLLMANGWERRSLPWNFFRYLLRKDAVFQEKGLMTAAVLAVSPGVEVGKVIQGLIPGRYHLLLVVSREGKAVGWLTEKALMDAYWQFGPRKQVEEILESNR